MANNVRLREWDREQQLISFDVESGEFRHLGPEGKEDVETSGIAKSFLFGRKMFVYFVGTDWILRVGSIVCRLADAD
jgi:hypothetical protein